MATPMRRHFALIALTVLAWSWVAAIIAAPHTDARVSAATYVAGSLVCHQRPERSFHLEGAQLAVCARCTGLYVGGALGVSCWLLAALLRRRMSGARLLVSAPGVRTMLAIAGAPTLITVATGMLGLWDPHNLIRAALATPLGAGIGALVAAAAAGDLR
jgi:uncharacterized membrane protein